MIIRHVAPSVFEPMVRGAVEEEGITMRGIRLGSLCLLALAIGLISGCQTAGVKRPATVVSPSPTVTEGATADSAVAEKTISPMPVRTARFADRHPLFTKPRQYWETSGDNKVVKAAAATFIGVPAGFVGEVKQIFVGAPPQPIY